MTKQARVYLFVAMAITLLLAACGGADTNTTGDNVATGDTRVKENAALGAAPVIPVAEEGPADRGATGPTSDVAAVCLTDAEGELARLVNEYRASLNLPPMQISKSLSLVAQQHAWDSVNNQNAWPAPPAGQECNLHSWSGVVNPALQQGTWTAVCYTSDHANAAGMWNKPAQIAGFPGEGVENSFWSSGTASPVGALTGWKNSPGHNNVITQQGGCGPMAAMGVGMSGGVAHLWMSSTADPAGEALLCSGGSAMTPPTAVPPTAVPPTAVPPTAVPPTAVPPTAVPPTAVPPTAEAGATAAPTAVPPTAVPPTAVPPTAVPPTAPPVPTGVVLNEEGTVAAGGSQAHTFDVFPGRSYTTVVSPAADFDAEPAYECTWQNGSASGTFDLGWEGEEETFTFDATAQGKCTVTVKGYGGAGGSYTIRVTAR